MCFFPSASYVYDLEGNFLLQMVPNIGTLIIYLHGNRNILLLFLFRIMQLTYVCKLIKNTT
jgi:hypothetical protein